MVPLLVAVPFGSMLAWKRGDLAGVTARLLAAFAVTAGGGAAVGGPARLPGELGAGGVALGVWVIAGSLNELALRLGVGLPLDPARIRSRARGLPRSAWSMTLAHVGLGVLMLGITVQSAGHVERIIVMRPGETVEMVGYQVRLDGVGRCARPELSGPARHLHRDARGAPVTVLHSERRYFPVERMPTTEAGIDTNLWRDLYFVLGDPAEGGGFAVRLYYNPLVLWIWGGAGIMALGGAALAQRPAAARRRPPPGAAPSRAAARRGPDHGAGVAPAGEASAPAVRPAARPVPARGRVPGDRPDPRSQHPALGAGRQACAGVQPAAAWRGATSTGSAAPTWAASRCWSTCSRPGASPAGSSIRSWRGWASRASSSRASTTRTGPRTRRPGSASSAIRTSTWVPTARQGRRSTGASTACPRPS